MSTYMGLYATHLDAERRAMKCYTTNMARIITTEEQQHKTWDFLNKKLEDQAKRRATKLL